MKFLGISDDINLPSLKLTAKAPETLGLEDEFPFGFRPPARCELLFLGTVLTLILLGGLLII